MRLLIPRRISCVFRWMAMVAVLIIPQVLQATQWNATVGAQSKNKGRQALAFLPNEIWIHAGDSIKWTFDADEIHTLTFLQTKPTVQVRPPFAVGCPGFSSSPANFDGTKCVSTPPLVKGQTFTVEFPEPGNFKVVCLVHANMTGVVHVLELSKALPHTQDFYDDAAEDEAHELLSDAEVDDHDAGQAHGGNHVTAGTGEISATPGGSETLSILRFIHHTTVIHVGQTVEWGNEDPVTPHTITFGTEPPNLMMPSANVSTDADGALHATINSTSDKVHSGFIVAARQDRIGLAQSPLGVTRFRVTFTMAGTYDYICALHDDLGMKGKIVVLP